MRAVVTGGAGFIGSHLADALLARGDSVTVVDDLSTGKRTYVPSGATFVEHDIREPLSLQADVVFHLAAQADVGTSMEQPVYDAQVNVIGTVNVLEAARQSEADFVFVSTGGAIYGEVEAPANEDTPRRPVSAYGIAKLAAEEYVAGWRRMYGQRGVVCRLANVYGPRQSSGLEGGVVSIFLERMARGQDTTIFGDGGITRDFIHVADVVEALLAVAGRTEATYNVGTGIETSIAELHRVCLELAGSEATPNFGPPRPGDARRSVLDASRAADDFGWKARIGLEAGIRDTWEWIRTIV